MAKIEDVLAPSFQFAQGEIPSAPSSGNVKLYAKTDGKIYSQVSDGTESALTNDTRYKGLRLARQIVLPEAAAIIEFNTDDDGNPLNSVLGGELLFYSGENTSIATVGTCNLQINGISTSEYWSSSITSFTRFSLGTIGALFSKIFCKIAIMNENIVLDANATYRYSTSGTITFNGGGMTTPQTAVTAIKLFLSSGTFPAGTVVEWWERG